MSATKYPRLKRMFGVYFHDEWDSDGVDWPDLVQNYLRDTSPDEAAAAASEIALLLAEGDSDERLEARLFDEFGCYYDHEEEGPDDRTWLVQIADVLRSASKA